MLFTAIILPWIFVIVIALLRTFVLSFLILIRDLLRTRNSVIERTQTLRKQYQWERWILLVRGLDR